MHFAVKQMLSYGSFIQPAFPGFIFHEPWIKISTLPGLKA